MTMIKPSCTNCSHIDICYIYKLNVEELKKLDIPFRVSKIADICPHYERKKVFGGNQIGTATTAD